jgi:prevent-host-death family protein
VVLNTEPKKDLKRGVEMKEVHVSSDIVPLGELKSSASRLLRQLKETHRPLVITQNGRPAAVMLRPEDFDALVERQRFVESVERGLRDVEEGRTYTEEEVEARLFSSLRADAEE